jgi:cystathionine gamma-lyase
MSIDRAALDQRFAAMLHAGSKQAAMGESCTLPLVSTATYALSGDPAGPQQYGRWSNPTWSALEEALARLEGAEVIAFPSGMAAIAAVYYALLRPGDRILLPTDGYFTTRLAAEKYLAPMGVVVEQCPTAQLTARDLTGFALVWAETPSNQR